MKTKYSVFVFIILTSVASLTAQDYSGLDKISLSDKTECANNEKLVLECCDYILKSPLNKIESDENHLKALQFIMRWMEATPDYSFALDETMALVTESNPSLFGILLVSMSKYALENKTDDVNDVKYNSFLTLIHYCEDPSNNVKISNTIRELIKARDENTLKEFLNIKSNEIIAMSNQSI